MADADTTRLAIALARLWDVCTQMKIVVEFHEPDSILIDRYNHAETFLKQQGVIS